ncbi:MAG: hypothetical protein F6J95_023110 [Leptolyngbya sp. SIO1E4]|nr:hypothetical protein [Leptolyngbya sp. SIO1E4]
MVSAVASDNPKAAEYDGLVESLLHDSSGGRLLRSCNALAMAGAGAS